MSTQITIVGNITADPELRHTPAGAATVSFTIAVNERRLNRETNQYEDAGATFWKCNAWRALAEHLAVSLQKGDHLLVVGTVKDHSFEAKDGERRTIKEIEVEEVGLSLRFHPAQALRETGAHGQR